MTQTITAERRQSLRAGLRFTPYAWAKLLFMCHTRSTEVSGMGIGAEDDPMTIEDIEIIKQRCNPCFTDIDSDAYADRMVDLCDPEGQRKLTPQRCQRVWIHTHPAGLGVPSVHDDETFEKSFGLADWAVMFIYSKSADVYCQLRMTARNANGVATELRQEVPVSIAWDRPFPAAVPASWAMELDAQVSTYAVQVYTPLAATGVMPHVRTGVVQPALPAVTGPRAPETPRTVDHQGRGMRRTGGVAKTKLVPMAGSLLAGLSSQQLVRLLTSDISSESLTTGGIMPRLEKNGWTLVTGEAPPPGDIVGNAASTVFFENKALPTRVFGNRDLALADRLIMTFGAPDAAKEALALAEFDLQAVAEDRELGEVGQVDSYGFDLDTVFPWHVPSRTVLMVSLNELEALLLELEDPTPAGRRMGPVSGSDAELDAVGRASDLTVGETRQIRDYIKAAWIKLKGLNLSAIDARKEIYTGTMIQHDACMGPGMAVIVREWVEELVNDVVVKPSPGAEETQEIEFNVQARDTPSMIGAKGAFRDLLNKAKSEGTPVEDIDIQLSLLYNKALAGKWVNEFIVLLKHIREHGYNPDAVDQPITITPAMLELFE